MMRKTLIRCASVIIGVGLLSACASTTVTAVWRDQNYSSQPRTALVILVTEKPVIMRVFEDEFAQQLKGRGIEAVPGYSLLPSDRKLEKEEIAAAAVKSRADVLFITRLVDKKSYETYYPGSVYVQHTGGGPGWRDNYARGYTSYQATPGYTVEQKILYVETQLYDVKTEQLVWSVMTETLVGDTAESEVKGFVKVIMKSLTEKGLVARP